VVQDPAQRCVQRPGAAPVLVEQILRVGMTASVKRGAAGSGFHGGLPSGAAKDGVPVSAAVPAV
jgi:hypothetical protein